MSSEKTPDYDIINIISSIDSISNINKESKYVSIKDIDDIIKHYMNNPYYLTIIINIILVCNGLRCSYLIELSNLKTYGIPFDDVEMLINRINVAFGSNVLMDVENEQFGRYLLYNETIEDCSIKIRDFWKDMNDYTLSNVLGYYCVGHDYSNFLVKRHIINYYACFISDVYSEKEKENIDIYTESCIFNEKIEIDNAIYHIHHVINTFNDLLKVYDLKVNANIVVDDGLIIRRQKLEDKDIKYVLDHSEHYTNDLLNFQKIKGTVRIIFDKLKRKEYPDKYEIDNLITIYEKNIVNS